MRKEMPRGTVGGPNNSEETTSKKLVRKDLRRQTYVVEMRCVSIKKKIVLCKER